MKKAKGPLNVSAVPESAELKKIPVLVRTPGRLSATPPRACFPPSPNHKLSRTRQIGKDKWIGVYELRCQQIQINRIRSGKNRNLQSQQTCHPSCSGIFPPRKKRKVLTSIGCLLCHENCSRSFHSSILFNPPAQLSRKGFSSLFYGWYKPRFKEMKRCG